MEIVESKHKLLKIITQKNKRQPETGTAKRLRSLPEYKAESAAPVLAVALPAVRKGLISF